jgi:glucosylceramidase
VSADLPQPVSLEGATATASANSAEAGLAIDADGSTVWTSKEAQAPGQWVQVDLGRAQTFRQLALDSGGNIGDYARGRDVAISNDGVHWQTIASGTSTGQLTTIDVRPVHARYLRITSTGSAGNWWSLADLRLYR